MIFVLLFSALVIGYWLAKYPIHLKRRPQRSPSSAYLERYYESMHLLLAEQPDAAIDAFMATLDVNAETLEAHMALGVMFNKRGEIDRAIRVHQNILAHPHLSTRQILQARLALAEDYLLAGLFDRAEVLYTELSQCCEVPVAQQALIKLVDVYQQEGEWQQAINTLTVLCEHSQALQVPTNNCQQSYLGQGYDTSCRITQWRQWQVYFYCEWAQVCLLEGHEQQAQAVLAKASVIEGDITRVQILQSQLASMGNNPKQALALLQQIVLTSSLYHAVVLPLWLEAFYCIEPEGNPNRHLADIYQQQPSALLLPATAKAIAQQSGESQAITFLVSALARWEILATVHEALALLPTTAYAQITLPSILAIIEKRLAQAQGYECRVCGYQGHEHHWQCPSCKSWGAVVAKL
ncbi:hypothetical protein [Marinagarivorans algicola]|uniref:hypothetical protein n=1 Tax=Marinagarivorans algicola TaxID=1513270 RepID=UPI0006B97F30|nr:hypothetical protein [Marinagarivorans algicola]